MKEDMYSRSRMLLDVDKLKRAKVLVCGLGGVGGYALEALVRAGVGAIDVLDADVFCESNLNRQLLATRSTIGRKKVDVAMERIADISPDCVSNAFDMFLTADNVDSLPLEYDCIIDAIDTVSAKVALIERAYKAGIFIVSCMGTGNKLGTAFKAADIYETSVCPLAKAMRSQLRQRGIEKLRVVYSDEQPISGACVSEEGRHIPGSVSYPPAIAGMVLASEVIRELTK